MRYLFTLVHGTFAADAEWVTGKRTSAVPIEKGEKSLREMLAKELEGNEVEFVDDFKWGRLGKSRWLVDLFHRTRQEGAKALVRKICEKPPLTTGERHFVIAHSHGGNVALYALKNAKVRARVTGLVCLATPFLYPRLRPLSLPVLWIAFVLLAVNLWASAPWVEFVRGGYIELGTSWLTNLASLFGAEIGPWPKRFMAVQVAALGLLLGWVTWFRFVAGDEGLEEHMKELSFTPCCERRDQLDGEDQENVDVPILLVRSSGDEATGLLRVGQFLNWVSGQLLDLLASRALVLLAYLLLFAFFVFMVLSGLIPSTEMDLPGVRSEAISCIEVAVGILNSVAFFLLSPVPAIALTIAFSRLFFAPDKVYCAGELETLVEDGPPGLAADIVVAKPPESPSGEFEHSAVYTRSATAREIASWCQSPQ